MNTVLQLTYLYMLILLLALLVERIMEIISAIWEFIEWKKKMYEFWNRKAEKLKRKFETKAKSQILSQIVNLTPLVRQIRHVTLSNKKGHSDNIIIISGDMLRQSVISAISRLAASIIGAMLCYFTHINVIKIFNLELGIEIFTRWPDEVNMILSGIIIGLGAEPVHNIITSMEQYRESNQKKAELTKRLAGAENQGGK